MAVAALAIGIVIAGAIRMVRTGSLARATVLARAIAADERAFLVAVFTVALGLRLLYVTRIMSDPNYLDAGADGRVYDELGWSIATGAGIPPAFADRFPLLLLGYVWFIAGIYSLAGHSYVALTAVQAVLGATVCLLLYGIAHRLFGRPTARVAAGFAAVSFPLVFAAATIGHQALDVFLTTLLVWLLLPLITAETRAWRWGIAGVVFGLAFAVRETNIFLMVFLLPWIALTNPGGWRTSGPRLASFAVAAALVVLPFLAPKMWTREDRQAMGGHFDRMYRGEGGSLPADRTGLVGPLADPQAALTQLASEPWRVMVTLTRAYAKNFAVQFFTQPYGGFDLVFLRKGSEYYYGMWFYAYALTCAGTIVALRSVAARGVAAGGVILIFGVIASRTFPHLMLVSDYRHRVPIEPLLIVLAAIGAVALFRAVNASAASTSTSGLTGSDWRVSHSNGR
jgi:4-amino-4-deoxy-L-arabinose transferase-like glycosyltransferase